MSPAQIRSDALAAAVSFLAAKGRFNPFYPGDVTPTGEEVMRMAYRFTRFIEDGAVVTDREAYIK